ncbi:MAG: sugar ABC transporter substrate-binding protein [Actinobacteria bacterium]|nr:sugar ABC transporter substrate-binding protein [Actinomycetota bacterium]
MRTKQQTRVALGLVVATTVVAALGACSAQTTGSDAVTLTFLHTANADPTWAKAIAAFEKQHRGVTIKEQQTSFDDLNSQVQARLGTKDPSIDVYTVDGPRLANMAAQGFLADVSSDKSEIAKQTGQSSVDEVTYDGKQYAFPQWTSTNLMFYNKDLVAKAGLTAPSADPDKRMTWERVIDDATKAQAAGAKYGFGFEQVDRYYQLQPLFESAGGGSGLTGAGNLTPDITSAAWKSTAGWYGGLFESGLSPRGIPSEQMPDQFASGNIAYYVGGPWNTAAFEKSSVNWGVAPMPYFEGGKAVTTTGSWLVGVSPYSKHTDIATEFSRFITLDATGASLVNPEGLPIQKDSLKSYLEALAAKGGTDADLAGIIKYEIAEETGIARPTTVGYVDFETIMNNAFSDIRNGHTVDQTLQTASDKITSSFARYK